MKLEHFHQCARESFRSHPCSFTVHLTKGPGPLLWQHGLTLLYSILRNRYLKRSLSKRTLGHITIELNRQGQAPLMMGQALQDMLLFRQHLLAGRGVDLLLRPDHLERYPELTEVAQLITVQGQLEQQEELESEYAQSCELPDMMSFATYLVSEKTMDAMEQFFHQYRQVTEKTRDEKEPRAGNRYGFGADPLQFEGAGCATLARAFFQLAGLDHHYQELCHRHLHLSPAQWKKSGKKKISDLFNLSLQPSKAKQRAVATKTHQEKNLILDIPDPALFHDRVHQYVMHREDINEDGKAAPLGTFLGLPVIKAERWHGTPSRHLVLDAR